MPETENTGQPAEPAAHARELVVVQPFDGYSRGDLITDPALVSDILAGERSQHVVQRAQSA